MTHHHGTRRALARSALATAVGALLAVAPAAHATFPGENGVIAFGSNGDYLGTNPERDFEIFTMTPAGTVLRQLTHNAASDNFADWSPDGSRIAFRSRRDAGDDEIYVMHSDGTGQRRLTNSPGVDDAPSWSADGGQILWQSDRSGNLDIYLTNADGTSPPTALTDHPAPEGRAVQAPDGRTIAFVREDPTFAIYTMRSDGRNLRKLTDDALQAATPNWSPDGRAIAFNHNFCGACADSDIFTMRPSGSITQRITAALGNNLFPSWSPDGEKLAFTHFPGADIYVTDSDGSGAPVNLTNTPTINDQFPAWQPVPDED